MSFFDKEIGCFSMEIMAMFMIMEVGWDNVLGFIHIFSNVT
jgi:hypothetical protein